jgi:peptidoglycan/LPS O-acetylase OafA/YrhL
VNDKKQGNPHIIQLDGLRFFAILMVLIAHWLQWQTNKPIYKAFPFTEGVTLFFVLSGYLITDILLRNKLKYEQLSISKLPLIRVFYIRRILRIFPIYFLTIFFLLFISYRNIKEIFPWLATFSSNIYMSFKSEYMGDFNHFGRLQ